MGNFTPQAFEFPLDKHNSQETAFSVVTAGVAAISAATAGVAAISAAIAGVAAKRVLYMAQNKPGRREIRSLNSLCDVLVQTR